MFNFSACTPKQGVLMVACDVQRNLDRATNVVDLASDFETNITQEHKAKSLPSDLLAWCSIPPEMAKSSNVKG